PCRPDGTAEEVSDLAFLPVPRPQVEVSRQDEGALTAQDGLADGVLQFPDVPGPLVLPELRQSLRVELRRRALRRRRGTAEKVLGQELHVPFAVGQAGQAEIDLFQT